MEEEDNEEGEGGEDRDDKAWEDERSELGQPATCSLSLSKGSPPCGPGNTPITRETSEAPSGAV